MNTCCNNTQILPGQITAFEGYGDNGCLKFEPIKDTVCRALGSFPMGDVGVAGKSKYIGDDCKIHVLPDTAGGFSGQGTNTAIISTDQNGVTTVDVLVSQAAGNALTINGDGLYVPTTAVLGLDPSVSNILKNNGSGILLTCADVVACETPISTVQTATLTLSGSGTSNHTIQGNVRVSLAAGNSIITNPDGLWVGTSAQTPITIGTLDGVTASVSGTNNHTLDISANIQHDGTLSGDGTSGNPLIVNACNVVQQISYLGNALSNGDFVVVQNGPSCEVKQFNVSAQTPITTVNTNSVTLTASGLDNHTLQADVVLDITTGGNLLSVTSNGLFLDCTAIDNCQADIIPLTSTTIQISSAGSHGHAISADVLLDSSPLNLLQPPQFSGLLLTCADIDGCQADIVASNTSSVTITSGGSHGHSIAADVNISATPGNQVSIVADGLYVPQFIETPLTALDSPSIDFNTGGTSNHTLTADVITAPNGGVQILPLGLAFDADGLPTDSLPVVNGLVASTTLFPNGALISPSQLLCGTPNGGTISLPITDTLQIISNNGTTCQIRDLVDRGCDSHYTTQVLGIDNSGVLSFSAPVSRIRFRNINSNAIIHPTQADTFLVDASAGNIVLQIALALAPIGLCLPNSFKVKRTDNNPLTSVTIIPLGGLIDNVASITIGAPNPAFGANAGESVWIEFDGTNYWIV